MEFYYKIFLFWDTFIEGKIEEKLIPIFFSFTKDHNLYSSNINPNIFIVLKQRYIELNNNDQNLYYCIFKYSKGITISYFSEPLAQILGYLQSELIDSDIDILMPSEISKPHNNMLTHYLITQQNRVYKDINNRLFNKKGLLYNGSVNGSALLGLGKNLLVMINARIIEKEKEFFLYYNQSLNLISFSNNFGDCFSLDLDLINKSNLNLLTLFGINQDLLQKKLGEIKLAINHYKTFLEAMTEEIYSKKLYKPVNKYNVVKYKLFEEIESHNFEETEIHMLIINY
jgi:PAS domain S-box-containing protein